MFDLATAGLGRLPPDDGGLRINAYRPTTPRDVKSLLRITVQANDLTCGDRVLELFDLCRGVFREGGRHVVIDLHSVTRADTKIVACLVALYQIARTASARLEVSLSQAVLEIANVCRLNALVRELSADCRTGLESS